MSTKESCLHLRLKVPQVGLSKITGEARVCLDCISVVFVSTLPAPSPVSATGIFTANAPAEGEKAVCSVHGCALFTPQESQAEVEKLKAELAEEIRKHGELAKKYLAILAASKVEKDPMECGHNSYWRTIYGGCMACRAEAAENKLFEVEAERDKALELNLPFQNQAIRLSAELAALKSTAKEVEAVVQAAKRVGESGKMPMRDGGKYLGDLMALNTALAALSSKPEGKPPTGDPRPHWDKCNNVACYLCHPEAHVGPDVKPCGHEQGFEGDGCVGQFGTSIGCDGKP